MSECPECGSENLEYAYSVGDPDGDSIDLYDCEQCGEEVAP